MKCLKEKKLGKLFFVFKFEALKLLKKTRWITKQMYKEYYSLVLYLIMLDFGRLNY